MTGTTAETPPTDAAPRRWSAGRIVVTVATLGMLAMWAYIVYLAFFVGRQPPLDRLEDPTFAPAAEARCSEALDEVAALPRAVELRSASERADVIEEANRIFADMLDDLEALAPQGEEGDMVARWVADWRTYLGDRAAFAEALREDPGARLFVSTRNSEQVTEFIDGFAKDNRMPACATPLDV